MGYGSLEGESSSSKYRILAGMSRVRIPLKTPSAPYFIFFIKKKIIGRRSVLGRNCCWRVEYVSSINSLTI
ncbi:hypothetical protein TNCV_4964331 [Trichonephila clavipes]|nr:hypothetical protein TNCV_4964331 [Trichonephila clavipes]